MKTFATLFFLFFSLTVFGQAPLGGLAEMDASAFRLDATHAQVEIDYGILYRTLVFTSDPAGSNWTAPVNATAEIWQGGKVVQSQQILQKIKFAGTKKQLDDASATKAVGAITFSVPYAGDSKAALLWHYQDAKGSSKTDTMLAVVHIPDSTQSKVAISSIELASKVEKADPNTPSGFDKAGYIVTPNPSDVYGDVYTKLYYYVEFYVPTADPSQQFDIVSTILSGTGSSIASTTRQQSLLATTIPFIGTMNIDGLPGGSYNLVVEVKKGGVALTQMTKQFFFQSDINFAGDDQPEPAAVQDKETIYLGSQISKMTESEVDDAMDHSRYVLRSDDKKAFEKIKELDGKRRFFFTFWLGRDKAKEAPLTEYQIYMKRFAETNDQFTNQKTPGWKSDRGRIYILYGPPDRVQNAPFSTEAKAAIMWEYNDRTLLLVRELSEETGKFTTISNTLPHFIFVDLQGGGRYTLVNSNVQGEIQEQSWYTNDAKNIN